MSYTSKSVALIVSLLALLSAGTALAVKWSLFGSPEVYATGQAPLDVVIADFNQDGYQDVATANREGRSVSIFAGNGDGSLTDIGEISIPGGGTSLASGDMNIDGIPDLVVSSCHEHCDGSDILILTGQGDGQFFVTSQSTLAGVAYNVAIADFNSDGLPDVAASDYPNDRLYVLTQQTPGVFSVTELPCADKPIALQAADINNDGRVDLLSSNHGAGSSSLYLSVETGFENRVDIPTGSLPYAIKLADMNNDQILDLLVAHSSEPAHISIFRGQGDGNFELAYKIPVDDRLVYIDSADFNSDGLNDIIVTRNKRSYASVYLNKGDFDFIRHGIPIQAHNNVYSLAVGDLDSDGLPDLVTVDYEASSLSVSRGGKLDSPPAERDPALVQ
ncbi:MAG: VCBS repeat-containing protein [Oligoflexia bacterium]|nr:VCBS repeat-containing protein [Oligoflexia bacterium]